MTDTTGTIGDILQEHAATVAQDLQFQERLKNPETALGAQNREQVGRIMSDAHSAATAGGVNIDIGAQTASVGLSIQVGDGRIGAQVEAGVNGTGARIGYTNGNFGLTASARADTRIAVGYQSLQSAPSTFDLGTIGQRINTAATEYRATQPTLDIPTALTNGSNTR